MTDEFNRGDAVNLADNNPKREDDKVKIKANNSAASQPQNPFHYPVADTTSTTGIPYDNGTGVVQDDVEPTVKPGTKDLSYVQYNTLVLKPAEELWKNQQIKDDWAAKAVEAGRPEAAHRMFQEDYEKRVNAQLKSEIEITDAAQMNNALIITEAVTPWYKGRDYRLSSEATPVTIGATRRDYTLEDIMGTTPKYYSQREIAETFSKNKAYVMDGQLHYLEDGQGFLDIIENPAIKDSHGRMISAFEEREGVWENIAEPSYLTAVMEGDLATGSVVPNVDFDPDSFWRGNMIDENILKGTVRTLLTSLKSTTTKMVGGGASIVASVATFLDSDDDNATIRAANDLSNLMKRHGYSVSDYDMEHTFSFNNMFRMGVDVVSQLALTVSTGGTVGLLGKVGALSKAVPLLSRGVQIATYGSIAADGVRESAIEAGFSPNAAAGLAVSMFLVTGMVGTMGSWNPVNLDKRIVDNAARNYVGELSDVAKKAIETSKRAQWLAGKSLGSRYSKLMDKAALKYAGTTGAAYRQAALEEGAEEITEQLAQYSAENLLIAMDKLGWIERDQSKQNFLSINEGDFWRRAAVELPMAGIAGGFGGAVAKFGMGKLYKTPQTLNELGLKDGKDLSALGFALAQGEANALRIEKIINKELDKMRKDGSLGSTSFTTIYDPNTGRPKTIEEDKDGISIADFNYSIAKKQLNLKKAQFARTNQTYKEFKQNNPDLIALIDGQKKLFERFNDNITEMKEALGVDHDIILENVENSSTTRKSEADKKTRFWKRNPKNSGTTTLTEKEKNVREGVREDGEEKSTKKGGKAKKVYKKATNYAASLRRTFAQRAAREAEEAKKKSEVVDNPEEEISIVSTPEIPSVVNGIDLKTTDPFTLTLDQLESIGPLDDDEVDFELYTDEQRGIKPGMTELEIRAANRIFLEQLNNPGVVTPEEEMKDSPISDEDKEKADEEEEKEKVVAEDMDKQEQEELSEKVGKSKVDIERYQKAKAAQYDLQNGITIEEDFLEAIIEADPKLKELLTSVPDKYPGGRVGFLKNLMDADSKAAEEQRKIFDLHKDVMLKINDELISMKTKANVGYDDVLSLFNKYQENGTLYMTPEMSSILRSIMETAKLNEIQDGEKDALHSELLSMLNGIRYSYNPELEGSEAEAIREALIADKKDREDRLVIVKDAIAAGESSVKDLLSQKSELEKKIEDARATFDADLEEVASRINEYTPGSLEYQNKEDADNIVRDEIINREKRLQLLIDEVDKQIIDLEQQLEKANEFVSSSTAIIARISSDLNNATKDEFVAKMKDIETLKKGVSSNEGTDGAVFVISDKDAPPELQGVAPVVAMNQIAHSNDGVAEKKVKLTKVLNYKVKSVDSSSSSPISANTTVFDVMQEVAQAIEVSDAVNSTDKSALKDLIYSVNESRDFDIESTVNSMSSEKGPFAWFKRASRVRDTRRIDHETLMPITVELWGKTSDFMKQTSSINSTIPSKAVPSLEEMLRRSFTVTSAGIKVSQTPMFVESKDASGNKIVFGHGDSVVDAIYRSKSQVGSVAVIDDAVGVDNLAMNLNIRKAQMMLMTGVRFDKKDGSYKQDEEFFDRMYSLRKYNAAFQSPARFNSKVTDAEFDKYSKMVSYYLFDPVVYRALIDKVARNVATDEDHAKLIVLQDEMKFLIDSLFPAFSAYQNLVEKTLIPLVKNANSADKRSEAFLGSVMGSVIRPFLIQAKRLIAVGLDVEGLEAKVLELDIAVEANDVFAAYKLRDEVGTILGDMTNEQKRHFLYEISYKRKDILSTTNHKYVYAFMFSDHKFFFSELKRQLETMEVVPTPEQIQASFIAFATLTSSKSYSRTEDGSLVVEDTIPFLETSPDIMKDILFLDGVLGSGKTTVGMGLASSIAKKYIETKYYGGTETKALFVGSTEEHVKKTKANAGKHGISGNPYSLRKFYELFQKPDGEIMQALEGVSMILYDEATSMRWDDMVTIQQKLQKLNDIREKDGKPRIALFAIGSSTQGGWRQGMPTAAEHEEGAKYDYKSYGKDNNIASRQSFPELGHPITVGTLEHEMRSLVPEVQAAASRFLTISNAQSSDLARKIMYQGEAADRSINTRYKTILDKDGTPVERLGVKTSTGNSIEDTIFGPGKVSESDPDTEADKEAKLLDNMLKDGTKTVVIIYDGKADTVEGLPNGPMRKVLEKYKNQVTVERFKTVTVSNMVDVQGGEFDYVYLIPPTGMLLNPDDVRTDVSGTYMYRYLSVSVGRARYYAHVVHDPHIVFTSEENANVEKSLDNKIRLSAKWKVDLGRLLDHVKPAEVEEKDTSRDPNKPRPSVTTTDTDDTTEVVLSEPIGKDTLLADMIDNGVGGDVAVIEGTLVRDLLSQPGITVKEVVETLNEEIKKISAEIANSTDDDDNIERYKTIEVYQQVIDKFMSEATVISDTEEISEVFDQEKFEDLDIDDDQLPTSVEDLKPSTESALNSQDISRLVVEDLDAEGGLLLYFGQTDTEKKKNKSLWDIVRSSYWNTVDIFGIRNTVSLKEFLYHAKRALSPEHYNEYEYRYVTHEYMDTTEGKMVIGQSIVASFKDASGNTKYVTIGILPVNEIQKMDKSISNSLKKLVQPQTNALQKYATKFETALTAAKSDKERWSVAMNMVLEPDQDSKSIPGFLGIRGLSFADWTDWNDTNRDQDAKTKTASKVPTSRIATIDGKPIMLGGVYIQTNITDMVRAKNGIFTTKTPGKLSTSVDQLSNDGISRKANFKSLSALMDAQDTVQDGPNHEMFEYSGKSIVIPTLIGETTVDVLYEVVYAKDSAGRATIPTFIPLDNDDAKPVVSFIIPSVIDTQNMPYFSKYIHLLSTTLTYMNKAGTIYKSEVTSTVGRELQTELQARLKYEYRNDKPENVNQLIASRFSLKADTGGSHDVHNSVESAIEMILKERKDAGVEEDLHFSDILTFTSGAHSGRSFMLYRDSEALEDRDVDAFMDFVSTRSIDDDGASIIDYYRSKMGIGVIMLNNPRLTINEIVSEYMGSKTLSIMEDIDDQKSIMSSNSKVNNHLGFTLLHLAAHLMHTTNRDTTWSQGYEKLKAFAGRQTVEERARISHVLAAVEKAFGDDFDMFNQYLKTISKDSNLGVVQQIETLNPGQMIMILDKFGHIKVDESARSPLRFVPSYIIENGSKVYLDQDKILESKEMKVSITGLAASIIDLATNRSASKSEATRKAAALSNMLDNVLLESANLGLEGISPSALSGGFRYSLPIKIEIGKNKTWGRAIDQEAARKLLNTNVKSIRPPSVILNIDALSKGVNTSKNAGLDQKHKGIISSEIEALTSRMQSSLLDESPTFAKELSAMVNATMSALQHAATGLTADQKSAWGYDTVARRVNELRVARLKQHDEYLISKANIEKSGDQYVSEEYFAVISDGVVSSSSDKNSNKTLWILKIKQDGTADVFFNEGNPESSKRAIYGYDTYLKMETKTDYEGSNVNENKFLTTKTPGKAVKEGEVWKITSKPILVGSISMPTASKNPVKSALDTMKSIIDTEMQNFDITASQADMITDVMLSDTKFNTIIDILSRPDGGSLTPEESAILTELLGQVRMLKIPGLVGKLNKFIDSKIC
jgi:hypothetical protein